MSRRLARSFFWIDQQLIRGGLWIRLSPAARLAYIALSASCDREGISIWSRSKLMALSGCVDPDEWRETLIELEGQRLIEPLENHSPPALKLLSLELEPTPAPDRASSQASSTPSPSATPTAATWPDGALTAPIIVHTQTTVHLGRKATHAEPGSPD